ncbi:hypothetical protein BDZ97DRAFT_1872250, partial [Flammula alnicola]
MLRLGKKYQFDDLRDGALTRLKAQFPTHLMSRDTAFQMDYVLHNEYDALVVQVGAEATTPEGIFQFIPPTVTAKNGTTVTFKFTGAAGNYTVTQSTFADPCFDSGWVFVAASPALTETPEWNLTITDDSKRAGLVSI